MRYLISTLLFFSIPLWAENWRDPLQQGDFHRAESLLKEASLGADGFYNLGTLYAQWGQSLLEETPQEAQIKLEKARLALIRSLHLSPQKDTQRNLAIVKGLLKQLPPPKDSPESTTGQKGDQSLDSLEDLARQQQQLSQKPGMDTQAQKELKRDTLDNQNPQNKDLLDLAIQEMDEAMNETNRDSSRDHQQRAARYLQKALEAQKETPSESEKQLAQIQEELEQPQIKSSNWAEVDRNW